MTDKSTEKVIITLRGAGIAFDAKISPIIAADILKLSLAAEREDAGSGITAQAISDITDKREKVSLGEFVHQHEPTTYPEKVLAIAAYLKEFRTRESFSPEDIRPLFRTIGDVPPANFGRDFRIAISNSWVAPDDRDPNAFYVTSIGLKALNSNFDGDSIKRRKTRKRKKNNSSQKSK